MSAFEKATRYYDKTNIHIPKFELIEIEDYYVYYVMILGISEDIFFNADYSFLVNVAENYDKYSQWLNYIKYKQSKDR